MMVATAMETSYLLPFSALVVSCVDGIGCFSSAGDCPACCRLCIVFLGADFIFNVCQGEWNIIQVSGPLDQSLVIQQGASDIR